MNIRSHILRSKVARRIFLLFVTCSLLPSVALSIVSSRFVTRQLETQTQQRLQREARSIGMEILGRLALAESELRMISATLLSQAQPFETSHWKRLDQALSERFSGIIVIEASASAKPLLGSIEIDPELTQAARDHLASGGVHLSTQVDRAGVSRILLTKLVDDGPAAGSILAGEVNTAYLWGLTESISLPAHTELVVLDPARNVMFVSLDSGKGQQAEMLRQLNQSPTNEFVWNHQDTEYIGRSWAMFLNARYGSPSWTVVVSMTHSDAFAPLVRFTRLLPQVSLLCLSIVVLLSFIQIRRSLVPLESLRTGTERIARREFDTRVRVDSGDEFEQLADSFNSMAGDLGRQFRTLATLAGIDRAILSTVQEDEIVTAVLARIPDHFPCQSLAVAVFDAHGPRDVRTYVRPNTETNEQLTEKTQLASDERCWLTNVGQRPLLVSRELMPPHLACLAETGIEHCLLIPVLVREELAGSIALGYRSAPELDQADLDEARRLANQVAVALSNAKLIGELERVNWETLHAFARAVDANSPWTAGHSERVTGTALEIGRRLGLPEEDLFVIHRGGLLHDVGKIGVPTQLLDKPGALTPQEVQVMRSHVSIGARILQPISAFAREIPLVLYHHERYDGKGYPEGLAGDRIPFHARILAVADVFDALKSDRPYRSGWEFDRVLSYIREGSGTWFDPQVVAAFLEIVDQEGREGVEFCSVQLA